MELTFDHIVNGWKNYIFPDENVERLAYNRAEICSECENAKPGTYEKLMKDRTLKEVEGMKCSVCGCPLSTKLRSENETCPLGKW